MIKHLAVIMDGNRRWALARGLDSFLGHQEGAKAVEHVIKFCLETKIEYLSLYTFSLENLQRPPSEQEYVFNVLVDELYKRLDLFLEKGISIRFIGDRKLFPAVVVPLCEQAEAQTAHCQNLRLNLLFCYGSKQEIMAGVRKIAQKVQNGEIDASELTEENFNSCLWSAGLPEPDLIIRTGGRQRLSNFLLFQSAYSEFCFLDCLWPDITEADFRSVCNRFLETTRNFGY